MTLLSRRKRRTTARRTTPATLAAKFVALAALVGTPAVAQPPAGYTNPQGGMLPLPPGYRPRTPPPQAKAPPGAPPSSHGGGRVMYFQKPADAIAATGSSDGGDEVAQPGRAPAPPASVTPAPAPAATWTGPVATAAADVPAPALLPPPASRYLPPQPDAPPPAATPPAPPAAAPVAYQPPADPPVVANKQPMKTVPVPPEVIRLPPRENIFMVYNDLELEKAIMDRLRQDGLERYIKQYEASNAGRRPSPEEQRQFVDQNERLLVFPALPVVSPPGVAYQPKTASYAPNKVIVEPGYVVHRRLYFEEKNAERAGWDLGPLSAVVGATYFYRDVLLWPQAMATGAVKGFWDTSAGKCLPGTPNPYYLYPPGLTLTGTATEAAVITGAAFLFP